MQTSRFEPIREALGITEKKDNPDEREAKLQRLRDMHSCYSKMFEAKRNRNDAQTGPLLQLGQSKIEQACSDQLNKHTDLLVTLDYIGRFGIQNIGVYVDGIMTVDIDTVPASIDQVVFDDATKPEFWALPGEKRGTLRCRFCTNGQVGILEADKLGITDVATAADNTDENTLKFLFKATKPIESGQSLTLVITKKPADPKKSSQEVKSPPFVYTVGYAQVASSITKVVIEDKKVTVTGGGFLNTKAEPLTVLLHSDGKDKDVAVTLAEGQAVDKLTFDIPAGLPPGCWNVHVKLGSMETPAPDKADQKILSPAAPKLTEATLGTHSITVKGEQLVDTSGCGGEALTFQAGPKLVVVPGKLDSSTEATLNLPPGAAKGWTVHLLQGAKDVSNTTLK
jgi:hypothetical protein